MRKSASYLLDEISGIDDRFIAEAEAFRRRGKPRFTVLKIAAAVILCLSAVFVNIRLLFPGKGGEEPTTLYSVLVSNEEKAEVTGADGLTFEKGTLIWSDGGSYYSIKLSASDADHLARLIGIGSLTGGNAAESSIKVWFCTDDGITVSPELAASPGNTGYGNIFGYSPEIVPTDGFVKQLERLLSQA